MCSQTFKKSVNMREFKHSFGGIGKKFVVFAQTAGIVYPSESSFYKPTLSRFYALGNVNVTMKHRVSVLNKSAAIAPVCTKALYRRISFHCENRRPYSHCRIIQICLVDDHAQKTTQGIGRNVPLSAFCFFHPSKPRWSLA